MATCSFCGAAISGTQTVCVSCGTFVNQGLTAMGADTHVCDDRRYIEDAPCSTLVLQDIRDNTEILIPPPGGYIGRGGDFSPEHFSLSVSRLQLKAIPAASASIQDSDNQAWLIEYVGRAETVVGCGRNSITMEPNQTHPLFGGETLRLGDMLFRVKMAFEKPVEPEKKPKAWIITCPVCQTDYLVDDETIQIDECEVCCLAKNKNRIAERKPYLKECEPGGNIRDRRTHHVD